MKKYGSWLMVFVMIITLILCTFPSEAEQSDYVWILVDVIDYDNAEGWATANESPVYQSDYSCSQGSMSVKTSYIGKTDDWYDPPMKNGEGVRITANFSSPPEKLYPGEEVSISLTISTSDNTLSYFTFGASAGADFDKPEIMPGGRHRDATLFTNEDGEFNFQVGAANDYASISETLTAIPPAGREEGEQIALRQGFYRGISMGTYYIYEWQGNDYQPPQKTSQKESPPPQKKTSQKELPLPWDNSTFSVPFQGKDEGLKPSGTGISDLYGEVLVELYDDDGNYLDAYTPSLGEELAVNAVIITGIDSGVQLSLRDMTTFVMKSNSSVKIGDQSKNQNRLSILAGHVWGNVKQMLKDGSMDIEMSQGVSGIKGTTFILEEDGETSTVKVFEGEIEVTPFNEGKPVLVKGGHAVSATQAGIGDVQTFDMDYELSQWNDNVGKITIEAMEENKGGLYFPKIIAAVIVLLLVGGGISIFIVMQRRKRPVTMSGQHLYAPVSQSEQKFCTNCGEELLENSKYCLRCGQSIV